MQSENSVSKRSFFKEYFFYKLRGQRGIIIASSILSLFFLVSGIGIFSTSLQTIKTYEIYAPVYTFLSSIAFLTIAVLAGFLIISLISAVTAFKFYFSRSSMDTIGGLPLTYSQRFWGDFLSGLSAVIGPVLVSGLIGGVFWLLTQGVVDKNPEIFSHQYYFSFFYIGEGKYFMLGAATFVVMLIMIISAYAFAVLVASCRGKVGNSVLYSIIITPVLPIIFIAFGTFMLSSVTGVDVNAEIASVVSVFPPVGIVLSIYLKVQNSGLTDGGYDIMDNPWLLALALAVTAAVIVGAYFAGKRRKAERVGSGFVIKGAYHVITLLLVVLVIGVFASVNLYSFDMSTLLVGALIAFVFYIILELVQYRSLKVLWKSVIRYAGVAAVGFGFLLAAKSTNGFGAEKYLPNQNSIQEVWINGDSFYGSYYTSSRDECFIYQDSGAISVILEEHQGLIDNVDKLSTRVFGTWVDPDYQSSISIIYKLKNGTSVKRSYYGDKELINAASQKILEQPAFEIDRLKILDTADFTNISVTYVLHDSSVGYVKVEKIGELFALLKDDIIKNYSHSFNRENGYVTIKTDNSEYDEYFSILPSYTKTLEFLNNKDNVIFEGDPIDEVVEYAVNFYGDASTDRIESFNVRISSDSSSEYVQELISLFEPIDGGYYDYEGKIPIIDCRTWRQSAVISEENEARAVQLLLNIIAEQANLT